MVIIQLAFFMVRFACVSAIQPFQSLMILLTSNSTEEKAQAIKQGVFSILFLLGVYITFSGSAGLGIFLMLLCMILGALLIKENGTI